MSIAERPAFARNAACSPCVSQSVARFRSGRRRFLIAAPSHLMGTWIYLIGWVDGSIKVGRTFHPQRRLYDHMKVSTVALAWVHYAPCGQKRSHYTELQCIEGLAAIGRRRLSRKGNPTETFDGIDKATAIAVVRRALAEARQ